MRPKLAIVGTHKDTRDYAPFDDLDFDIWVFNEALSQVIHDKYNNPYKWVRRADAVFQMHEPAVYMSPNNRSDKFHWDWLQENHDDLKIYMQEVDPLVPNSVRYPKEDVDALLDSFRQGMSLEKRSFLTSTPAQAMALGIVLGYKHIDIYGCNMASETEYAFQREGFTFWVGYALGHGITINMYSGDEIFDRPIYGYEGYVETPPEYFKQRIDELTPAISAQRESIHQLDSRLNENWQNGVGEYISEISSANSNLGYLEGQLDENERYLFKIEQMKRDNELSFIDLNEYEMASAEANKNMINLGPLVYRTVGHVDLTLETYQFTKNPHYLPQLKFHVQDHIKANYEYGRAQGKFEENRRFANDMYKRIQAAGGTKSVQSITGCLINNE
jgi:hypothetical protein